MPRGIIIGSIGMIGRVSGGITGRGSSGMLSGAGSGRGISIGFPTG